MIGAGNALTPFAHLRGHKKGPAIFEFFLNKRRDGPNFWVALAKWTAIRRI
jgi:hypothetical protein